MGDGFPPIPHIPFPIPALPAMKHPIPLPFTSPLLDAYRNMRDRTLRGESLFIAEGDLVVERLLDSPFPVASVMVVDAALGRVGPMLEEKVPGEVPVYVVPAAEVESLVGFPFHQGVLAVGRRERAWRLEDLTADGEEIPAKTEKRRCVVVMPDVTKPDNLGNVFRSSAALGADGILLGPQACDPLSRRAMRVSMGGVMQLPWVKTDDLARDLNTLRSRYGYTVFGTVLDGADAALAETAWPARVVLCFGNEYAGLDAATLACCDRRVTIPMTPGVDSLNLGVSAGIFLYDALRR